MTIAGALTPAAPILVDRNTKGVFTQNFALYNTADAETVFASSNAEWLLKQSAGEAKLVGTPYLAVTLDPGTAAGTPVTDYADEETYVLPACCFTAPAAKMFTGWSDGAEIYSAGAGYPASEGLTFTAQWTYGETFSYELHDSWGDGWNGNAILVKDAETGEVLESLTIDNGSAKSGTFNVPSGKTVVFEWQAGSFADECSYEVKDSAGNVVFSGSNALASQELTVPLDGAKAAAKAELENYKNPDDYRDAQKADLAKEVADGKDAIDGAESVEAIEAALAAAKTEIDKIKTDAELTAEELAAAKEAAKAELENYKNPDDYRDAQKADLAKEVADGKDAIDAAEDIEAVAAALAAAKEAIDAIKTDAELTAEELAAAKADAKAALESYKNPDDYRDAEKAALAAAIAAGQDAIDAAEDVDAVYAALADAMAAIDAIKTDAQLTAEATCPYCGKIHSGGLLQVMLGFFHSLLVAIRRLFTIVTA